MYTAAGRQQQTLICRETRLQRTVPKASLKLEFHGTDTDMDTDTDIRDAPSCNFVNVYIAYRVQYTSTRVHAREENRACRTSRRGSSCVFGYRKSPDTPTSSRRSSRGSRRRCPCRCRCPCRRRGMPALHRSSVRIYPRRR